MSGNGRRLATATISAVLAALAFTAVASAQWVPGKPGSDTRKCGTGYTTDYCVKSAATYAFMVKYKRLAGRDFAGEFHCTQLGPLAWSCAWNTMTNGEHVTVVRFAHKARGWVTTVGPIPTS